MIAWQQLAAAAAAGIVAGAIAGWSLHRPAVQVHVVEREKILQVKAEEKTTEAGPRVVERVVTRTVPGPRGPERIVERERILQGPTTTVYRERQAAAATRELEHSVSILPAPRASWALYGGLQLVPERLPVLGLSRRLVGPIWIEAWARPQLELALPAAGVGLRVEF